MIEQLLRTVAKRFDVSVADIKSQRRNRQVLPARHVVAYLAHTALGMAPRDIGERIGGRDYTNVVMYCRAVSRRMQEDEEFRLMLRDLEAGVRQP